MQVQASASDRWFKCSFSAQLKKKPYKPSAAAQSGQRQHKLLELSINQKQRDVRKVPLAAMMQEKEVATVQMAMNQFLFLAGRMKYKSIKTEQRIDLPSPMTKGFADITAIDNKDNLVIIDFKSGFKTVRKTKQLEIYAAFHEERTDKAELIILQPNAKMGSMFSYTIDTAEAKKEILERLEFIKKNRKQYRKGAYCAYCPQTCKNNPSEKLKPMTSSSH